MTEDESTFRNLFMEAVSMCPTDAGLFLSGGVDSMTTLAAMMEFNMKPTCFTFYVEGIESRDVVVARSVCKHFKLTLVESVIPVDLERLIKDVSNILRVTENATKTHVQCSHPFVYMGRECEKHGLINMTWGMGAAWGLYRAANVAHAESPEKGREVRRNDYFPITDWSGVSIEKVLSRFGVKTFDPWYGEAFEEWFMDLTLDRLHQRFEKSLAVNAFREFWDQGEWYKKQDPLQVGSGIKDLHDKLLRSRWNKRNNVAVVGVYNDMLKELTNRQTQLL